MKSDYDSDCEVYATLVNISFVVIYIYMAPNIPTNHYKNSQKYHCNFTAFLYYSTTVHHIFQLKKESITQHTQSILHHRGTHHHLFIQTCTWKYTGIFLQISIQICDLVWLEIQQISFISLYKIVRQHRVF